MYPFPVATVTNCAKAEELPEEATEEEKQEAQLSVLDLEIFENAAWIMAWQYDKKAAGEDPCPTLAVCVAIPAAL